jgi:nucleotidyltransferase/DNA polymerase involved in DNA repair
MAKYLEKGQTLCIWFPMFELGLELIRKPTLQNTPVALLNPKKISKQTVWQCSKQARDIGIYLNQPISQAFSFCPTLIVLEPDLDYYNSVQMNLLETLSRISPDIEFTGHGRFFINVDGLQNFHKPQSSQVKKDIHTYLEQFPNSLVRSIKIGWAKGKFASWIAATKAKPNEPLIVQDQKLISFLKPSAISLLPIDKVMLKRLQQLGIQTFGDLGLLSTSSLIRQFGEKGRKARMWATGEQIDLVRPNHPLESIRHSIDFHTPIGHVEILCKSLANLLETALEDLKHRSQSVQSVRITALWEGGSWSLNHILRTPSISHEDIYRAVYGRILLSPPVCPIEKLILEFFQFCTLEPQENLFNHKKAHWEVSPNKRITEGTIPPLLREAIKEMKLRMGFSPLYRIVEIDPLSRIPERRHALLNLDI